MEVADKLRESLIKEHKVYKTNLTTDEAKEVNGIQNAEKVYAIPGKLMLSTFYIASGSAVNGYEGPLFDYVIVDEASQAFFAMLAATNMLGYKKLWVGDVYQMPPIVLMSHDRIKRQGYEPLVNGLDTITSSNKYSNYQLSDTFRLGTNAAKLTGLFYKGALRSLAKESNMVSQKKEGPVIIPIDMPIGDPIPSNAIKEAVRIASDLIQQNKKIEIAISSLLIKTTTALQVEVTRTIGNTNNILVETVARVQGITKDVTIYVIPNTDSMVHSLELRLFNVATSRAKDNTYIICPKDILSYTYMAPLVREYLVKLVENS
jgi:superfamily I DNA and/or RNA helicase